MQTREIRKYAFPILKVERFSPCLKSISHYFSYFLVLRNPFQPWVLIMYQ